MPLSKSTLYKVPYSTQAVKSTSLELICHHELQRGENWNWIVYFYFSLMCYMKQQSPVVFYEKCVLKNFTKFTGKHPYLNVLFLIKLQAWGLQFYKERDSDQALFSWLWKIFKSISERLLVSVKRTINCFYRRESCKYDSIVKTKTFAN